MARGTFGAYVVMDPVKLAEVLRGPRGPVVRRLIEDGQLVKREAQRLVGVYQPPDAYTAANRKRRPGTLRDSIVSRIVDRGGDPTVLVGSEDPIALYHHEGTKPHPIQARYRPALVFYWAGRPGGAGIVSIPVGRSVKHPGTQPNRYLTRALAVLRSRY